MISENHIKTSLEKSKSDLDKLALDMIDKCKDRIVNIKKTVKSLESEEERLEVILEELTNKGIK